MRSDTEPPNDHRQAGGIQKYQDLSQSRVPAGFRGRSAVFVQLWWFVQATLFRASPQILYPWRRFLLRLFGAEIGKGVLIRPTVTITNPWKIKIGDFSWIGDHVELYSLGDITIGKNAVVSQYSYLCAGSHDFRDIAFPLVSAPIVVGDEAWIAAHCFIGPGVTVGRGAVVGARSLVLGNVPEAMIVAGHPFKVVGPRSMKSSGIAPSAGDQPTTKSASSSDDDVDPAP